MSGGVYSGSHGRNNGSCALSYMHCGCIHVSIEEPSLLVGTAVLMN